MMMPSGQEKKEMEKEGNRSKEVAEEGRKKESRSALWSGTNKNIDVSNGPLARLFARSLAPLTRGKVNF